MIVIREKFWYYCEFGTFSCVADLIAGTSFGSHQIRIGPGGHIFSDQFNFSPRLMPGVGPASIDLGPDPLRDQFGRDIPRGYL